MTKEEKRIYDIDAIRERELGKGSPFPPVSVGGQEFTILPSSLWSDAAFTVEQTGDVVAAAKAMLGDSYDGYVAAGGTAALLMLVVAEMQGAEVPE